MRRLHCIITVLLILSCTNAAYSKKGCNASRGTLGRIYDTYKEELRTSYDTGKQDFLDDSASFRSSRLYDFCRKMPKGANLHVHGSAIMPIPLLVEFIKDHPSLKVNVQRGKSFGKLEYTADATSATSSQYMTMKEALEAGYTIDDFEKAWTLKGGKGMRPWDWFNGIFRKMSELTYDTKIEEDYYTRAFEYYIRQGVTHVEPRLLFFGTHEEALSKARALYRAQNEARRLNPDFSVSIVFCGLKAKTDDYNKSAYNDELFDNGLYVSENIKDTIAGGKNFIVGFDLVNEEDQSIPLKDFEKLVRKTKEANASLHITLHAGETNRTSNNEIASAMALGAERIGHGFNLYMHPELEHSLKKNGITIETCPISNKVLGYCKDLRLHPAVRYMQSGISVALGDDDPAYQMCSSFVDDVFVTAAMWNLPLQTLKQMLANSIKASFMHKKQKRKLMKAWKKQWKIFERETIRDFNQKV